MAPNTLNTHCFAPDAGDAYSSFFTLPNAYSSRRPTLATRTASPLALVLHHLILDVLTRLWRRTSPTHPYPTVTYGEWYDFSRCLLPRRQDVTDVTYARLSCLVYIITMHGSFHSRFSRIFLKTLRGRFKLNPNYSQMGIDFSIAVCLSPERHTVPNIHPCPFILEWTSFFQL